MLYTIPHNLVQCWMFWRASLLLLLLLLPPPDYMVGLPLGHQSDNLGQPVAEQL
ncbi:hypothetical protein BDV06DRAFT_196065 [Aspergillus oleicola]